MQGDEDYGVRRAALGLASEISQRGHEVTVLCMISGPLVTAARNLGLSVTVLEVGRVPNLAGSVTEKLRKMWALSHFERKVQSSVMDWLQELRPDALHVLWPSFVGLAGRCARQLGCACFWEMPNYVGGAGGPMNRLYYQLRCLRYNVTPLANSGYTAATLGHWPVKPTVFYLGVDAARFDPEAVAPPARAALHVPETATVVGLVARLGPNKGQDRLLQAIAQLAHDHEELHLLLVGGPTDGAFAEQLRSIARRAGLEDHLHLLGQVPDAERYYPLMDIVVNARVDPEPFGLTVIEAMMMGRPVLVHALGGPAETVRDGETGWHIHAPTVAALRQGLTRALSDRPRWPQMREAARQHALAHFTVSHEAERYLALVATRCGGAGDLNAADVR
jgi:glycosyltransferase involved in cell wall biosynthesis